MTNVPDWYWWAVANCTDPTASIILAARFLSASPAEQAAVKATWASGTTPVEWSLPNPWRLACSDEGPGSILDRIRTTLVFQALEVSRMDLREVIFGLAVIYNSCTFAGLDPEALFTEVAASVGGPEGEALMDFAARLPEERSMEAFMLTAVKNPPGGYEIRPQAV
jgi:hypothetical protein